MTAKDLNNALMDPDFVVDLLHLLAKYGLVNETALRNSIIRREHQESKAKGERTQDFMIRMAEKYFISEKSIDHILYNSKQIKNNSKGMPGNG